MSKMHSWVVKLAFYLNKAARSIFLTDSGGHTMAKKEQKKAQEGFKNIKSHILKPDYISKCPKFLI